MKLSNKSLLYLAVCLLPVISIWSVGFYFALLNEIKESTDEELENYKRQIVFQAEKEPSILQQKTFDEGFFEIKEISKERALSFKDLYEDLEILAQDKDDEAPELEPVRMLTTAFELQGKYYQLKVYNSMLEEDDLIKELLWEVTGLYILLLLTTLLINNFVLRRLWTPFYTFLSDLKKYRLGISKDFPKTATSTTEFIELQDAVDTVLQYSDKIFEQQNQFIGNASHELQTPLAIIISKLELLFEKETLNPALAQKISEVLQIAERLVRLNKSLLLLTKIENHHFFDNKELSVNEAVENTIDELREIAEFRNIDLKAEVDHELLAYLDPSLLNIIVANFLRNAIFHNEENGHVIVVIKDSKLIIKNTGEPVALDTEKVFSRFHKSDSVTSGTGLGLAIVKAIAQLYGFHVHYSYADGLHSFTIDFN